MQNEIRKSWFFQQPPAEVWEFLTKPELIEQWLSKTDFKPVVGHKFQFANCCETEDHQPHYTFCRVIEVIPNKLLSYTWQKGKDEKEITVDSVVTWTLSVKKGGTELNLQHNGFKLIEDIIAHSNGWDNCLNKIIELINTSQNVHSNA